MKRHNSIRTSLYSLPPALALVVALTVGWTGPSRADDPESTSEVQVPEQALPAQESSSPQPNSHVHDVGQPPDRSAKETLKDIWTRDKLSGEWGGLRPDLHDHGIDVGLRLSQYGQGVASGGANQNAEYGGRVDYRLAVDGKKLFGLWNGVSVSLHAMSRFGRDISADAGGLALPNAEMMLPLPGSYSGTQITGLTVNQSLFDGRAEVVAGKLDVIDLLTGFFPEIAYGQEGFWNVNSLAATLPFLGAVQGLSLWGTGAWTVKNEMVHAGFLITGTANVTTTWEFSDSFDEGVWMAGFYRFFWKLGDLPGRFLIFAAGSTRNQPSNDSHDFVDVPGQGITSTDNENPWDIAGYLYQEFWQAEGNPSRKAAFYVHWAGGPDDPQFAQWNIMAAVQAFGPMASRPHDRMGVSGWYNGLSDQFTDLTSDAGVFLRDTWGFELYYNVEINKWLHLTPDLQLVMNERKDDNFAIIPGIRLLIDF